MNNKISPVRRLYDEVMKEEGYQQGKSNIRYSHCKQEFIEFCIKFGIQFFEDDFSSRLPCPDEGWYALACGRDREFHNKSAVLAMEKYWKRKPFLLREPENKTPERIYAGRWIIWFSGARLLVTSFNDEKGYFTACQYKDNKMYSEYGESPIKRLKITHEDIKEFHKMLDENNALKFQEKK